MNSQEIQRIEPPKEIAGRRTGGWVRDCTQETKQKKKEKKNTKNITNRNQSTIKNNAKQTKQFQIDQNALTTKHQTTTTIVHNTDKFPLDKYQILIRNFPPDTSPETSKRFIDKKSPPYKLLRQPNHRTLCYLQRPRNRPQNEHDLWLPQLLGCRYIHFEYVWRGRI